MIATTATTIRSTDNRIQPTVGQVVNSHEFGSSDVEAAIANDTP